MGALQQFSEVKPAAPDEAQVRKWLAAGTEVAPGIFKTPGVCGGDACVGRTRITVGGLLEYQRLGADDFEILAMYPHLKLLDLTNAWEYARRFPDEIVKQIADNNSDDE